MFGHIIKTLFGEQNEQATFSQNDARLALVALLVRIARSDSDYCDQEKTLIEKIIAERYGLSIDTACTLRQQGENLESQAPDTVRFTRALKYAVPYEHRLDIVTALWQVVLVDNVRSDEENTLLRLITDLLGISDQDSARARHAAKKRNP